MLTSRMLSTSLSRTEVDQSLKSVSLLASLITTYQKFPKRGKKNPNRVVKTNPALQWLEESPRGLLNLG